jgi:hypothetical protein
MADPLGGLKKSAQDLKERYKAGNKETEGLGAELKARGQMNEEARKALSGNTPAAPEKKPASKPSPSDLVHPKMYGNPIPEAAKWAKPLGSMKKGGKVPKTGMYQLHAGEHVVPARAASALGGGKPAKKKGSGKVPHKMITEHMDDGSFQITHEHKPSMEPGQATQPPEKFTAANAKHLVRHVKQTYGPGQEDGGLAEPASYADGGDVLKGGLGMLHKGETVMPARKTPDFNPKARSGPKADDFKSPSIPDPRGPVKNPDIYIGGGGPKKATPKMPPAKRDGDLLGPRDTYKI